MLLKPTTGVQEKDLEWLKGISEKQGPKLQPTRTKNLWDCTYLVKEQSLQSDGQSEDHYDKDFCSLSNCMGSKLFAHLQISIKDRHPCSGEAYS